MTDRPIALAWGGSAAAFAGVLAVLGWQLAAGLDPAIGAGDTAAAPVQPKRIVVRRIVRKVILTGPAPSAPAAAGGTAVAASAPARSVAAAPVQAAPAPAPAPAAPVTRSS